MVLLRVLCEISAFLCVLSDTLFRNHHHRATKNTDETQRGKATTDTAKRFNTIIGSVPHSGGVKYL